MLSRRSRLLQAAGTVALTSLLFCQCAAQSNRPRVEQLSVQAIQKKEPITENKIEEKQEKEREPLEDSWSGGKCVLVDNYLRIVIEGRFEQIRTPKDIEWKYLFCSDKYTVLVSDLLIMHQRSPEQLFKASAEGDGFFVWAIGSLNHNLPGERPIGKVHGAEFDKELSALVVFGEKGARLFTFDYYPYIVDIMFDSEAQPGKKILHDAKNGFFVFCREGDTKYALCNMKTGEFFWFDTGEEITTLRLTSVRVNYLRVQANSTLREHCW
ncbi:MAG: hypothetical protein QXT45_00045 [Candidatus Bilamarchaeaceae archaeon]